MAKHRSMKKRNYEDIEVDKTLALGTLASGQSSEVNLTSDTASENFITTRVELAWAIRDLTPGEGPLQVGVAKSDYTTTEIDAFLENASGFTRGNLIQQEISRRQVRAIGVFPGELAHEVLNDGKEIKTRLNWRILEDSTLAAFIYNNSGASLTTGAVLEVRGRIKGFWED